MGLTHVKAKVANPANPRKIANLTLLVDSGAVYSIVPGDTLRRLGIKPHSSRTFTLADGTEIKRRMGDVIFQINGERAASPVIFGEKGDSILLGTVSLEALGFVLDPIKRVLKPLPMVLG
jgi:clan AA aspartic protease